MDKEKNENLQKPRILLLSWDVVASWKWDKEMDNCAICRNNIMDQCIECQSGSDSPKKCEIARGECNHLFHAHCIERWIKKRMTCPLDNNPWKYAN